MDSEYIKIKIATDFSQTPGPRLKEEGSFSGEEFYEQILKPKYLEAKGKDKKLFVDLDGTYGYGTSFLERSFGGLVREYGKDPIERIIFKSEEDPYLIEEINLYMNQALESVNKD